MTDHQPRNLSLPTPGCFADPDRSGLTATDVFEGMTEHLFYTLGKLAPSASRHDLYMALSYAVRDRLMTRYLAGIEAIDANPKRIVAYLSAEFLIGPQLGNNLLMLGIQEEAAEALRQFGINDIEEILDVEEEPGLGNGGLGRLAACFLESLASLEIPATGYGIRYEFGIFDQLIRDGWQVEITDKWLKAGWPWEIPRPDQACFVGFGGHTESYRDQHGAYRVRWIPAEHAIGVPHDVPVLGYRVNTCDRLRLWRADATESFDFYAFNSGDYYGAVEEKVGSETLSKVLYPNDGTTKGRQLRLKQQHFFVSCSLQDMIRSLDARGIPIQEFPEHWAIQLNDTHPSIAVAEMMRLLLDDKHLDWETAWGITTACLSYTNHTLLPEALEKWGLELFGSLLPRHLELIFEINRRFLQQVRLKYPGNDAVLRRLSIIDESGGKAVRMAHLATVASHHVNGVAALHSELVKKDLFPEFAALWPEKFTNVTNGVTPRRWVALANPQLKALLDETIGSGWVRNLEELRQLERYVDDGGFLERWGATKLSVKRHLTHYIHRHTGVLVDPASLFDVQVKRIHEYKRQHLNALQVIAQYLRIKNGPGRRHASPHGDLRRQGRPRLRHGQADHPLHQRHRRRGQRRSRHGRAPAGGLPGGLQREARGAGVPRRRSLGADLHRRPGGLRHRQHEIHDERGTHHRHPRWGQRGNPRAGGRRQLLPLRPHHRRHRRTQAAGLPALGADRLHSGAAGGAASDRARPLQQRRHRTVPPSAGEPHRPRSLLRAGGFRGLPAGPGGGERRLERPQPLEPDVPAEHRPQQSSSPPTARSGSTPSGSGGPRSSR